MSTDLRRMARAAASARRSAFAASLGAGAVLLLGSAPDRASAEVAFRDVLSGKPLDVPLPEGAQRTEAVVHFHKTGENLYNGKESAIEAGKKVYARLCASCHLSNLAGRMGPSLVDNESKYPRMNTDVGVFEIIYGGGAGAMQAFSKRGMSQDEMLQVIAYINSQRK
jgi:cytochrome c-L